jgi:hypothetical protein
MLLLPEHQTWLPEPKHECEPDHLNMFKPVDRTHSDHVNIKSSQNQEKKKSLFLLPVFFRSGSGSGSFSDHENHIENMYRKRFLFFT